MKKVIILFLFVFLNGINQSYSAWYGNHGVSYTAGALGSLNTTPCNSDGDTSGGGDATYGEWAVADNNSSTSLVPESSFYTVAASGTARCLYWDSYIPTGTISYLNGWTNTAQTISYNSTDAGGSKLKNVNLQRRVATISDTGVQGAWSGWANVATNAGSSNSFSSTYNEPITSNKAYQYREYTQDGALNNKYISSSNIIYMDNTKPVVNNLDNYNGWTNGTQAGYNNLYVNVSDKGGNKVKKVIIEKATSTDSPNFTSWTWSAFQTIDNINLYTYTNTFTYTLANNRAYKFRVKVSDYLGNETAWIESGEITKYDITPPSSLDISTPTSFNLLATNSQNFTVNISNNSGSPITYVGAFFEDYNSSSNAYKTIETSNNGTWSKIENISKVDNNRESTGQRNYSLNVSKVCDEAGNCTGDTSSSTAIRILNYYVYANTTTIGDAGSTNQVTTNQLTSTWIADGTARNLFITLKDKYGNTIIPAEPSGGINREVNLTFDVNNTLHLDQYYRSGADSAVYIKGDNVDIITDDFDNSSYDMINQKPDLDDIYKFYFKVYSPTYQNYKADPLGKFIINNINLSITDTIGNENRVVGNGSNIDFNFRPLYQTAITGDLRDYGFIEGADQQSYVNITSNGAASTSNKRVYLEFSGVEANKLTLHATPPDTDVQETSPLFTIFQGNSGFTGNKSLVTFLTQDVSPINEFGKHYLSTHISYTITGPNGEANFGPIVYNSDIIGKNNYHEDFDGNNTTQVGIKILGKVHDTDTSYITTEQQLGGDVDVLGDITKSSLRKDIREKVYSLIKFISPDNGTDPSITITSGNTWNNANDGVKLGDILYFGELGGANVELGNGGDLEIAGIKTIIVNGGNLYIRSNIINNTDVTNTDILGIIVTKDDNNNGGNVYIDPSVKSIIATIYADKSVLSYNETYCAGGELSTDCGGTLEALKNQLYIKGQVFAENTIGGSRTTPLQCPYYKDVEPSFVCTMEEAQKYDLNFLRRYFVYDSDYDGDIDSNDNPYGGYGTTNYFDRNSKYYKYPVVIEYNSKIQSGPPPLFGE